VSSIFLGIEKAAAGPAVSFGEGCCGLAIRRWLVGFFQYDSGVAGFDALAGRILADGPLEHAGPEFLANMEGGLGAHGGHAAVWTRSIWWASRKV